MAHKVCDCRHYPYDCWSCLEECDMKSKEPEPTCSAENNDQISFYNQPELEDYETY